MKTITKRFVLSLAAMLLLTTGCKKFLDEKSDKGLSTVNTLSDLQSILNNPGLNKASASINIGTDEYYLGKADWESLDPLNLQAHVWDPATVNDDDWTIQYRNVFYANTVLDHLKTLPVSSQQTANAIKGAALFFRAHSFYLLAQVYAGQYVESGAESALGIPLRLDADFNKPSSRSGLKRVYEQITGDLLEAISLLPLQPLNKTQPAKPAANALLARTYLQMGEFEKAREYAKASLQLHNTLIDFNTLNANLDAPIPIFNSEVLFYAETGDPVNIFDWMSKLNPEVCNLFHANDLRRTIFLRDNGDGSFAFKGSYNGDNYSLFNGIANDEVYLILAETEARMGNAAAAMESLNALLIKRFKTGTFIPLAASSADQALMMVLTERRKELIYRGLRWSDLKRLNTDTRFQLTLQRTFGATMYSLQPNDKRYAYLIPQDVINLTGITQNPR